MMCLFIDLFMSLGVSTKDLSWGSWLNSIGQVWPRTWNAAKPGGLSWRDKFRCDAFSKGGMLWSICHHMFVICKHISVSFLVLLGPSERDGGCWESGFRGDWRVQREPCLKHFVHLKTLIPSWHLHPLSCRSLVGWDRNSMEFLTHRLRTGIEKLRESFLGRGQEIVDEELLRQAGESLP